MKRLRMVAALLLALAMTRSASANPSDCSDYGCGTGVGDVIGWIDGTAIKSNGSICTGTCGGPEQCVELIKDYFPAHFGINYSGYGAAHDYFYNIGGRTDLKRYYNNSYDGPPQDGDAIVFDKAGTVGHIGMVRGRASSTVEICQQNWVYGVDPCVNLSMNISSDGKVSVGSQGSYYVVGWVRAVKNGVPVAPPNGGSSDNGNTTPPPTSITRAYAVGQGTANPEAWTEGYRKVGGFNELGLAVSAPAWDSNYVSQVLQRPDSGVRSLLVHDELHLQPYAYAIVDTHYTQFLAYGGLAKLGAPLDNKYDMGGGNYAQDFGNARMTHDNTGFHLIMNYPLGFTPGQGASNKSAFQFGYSQVGGAAFGNPAGAVFVNNGVEIQQFRDPSGKAARMVATPGYMQAFGVKGPIYDFWMAQGHVYGGMGVPTSVEYFVGTNETMQIYRFGVAHKSANGVVTFTPNSSSDPRRYSPGEGMPQDRGVHILTAYERNGGVGKLGGCTAQYDINSFNYQYCSGGAYNGRAAIVLNYGAANYVAVVVRGSIESYWEGTGGISGSMGIPYTEERPSITTSGSQVEEFGRKIMEWYNSSPHLVAYPYNIGLGQGATYWSPFAILRRLDAGKSGYPKTAIYWSGQGQVQDFAGGLYSGKVSYIHDATSRAGTAYLVKGGIGNKWWGLGGGNSYLGLPVTEEIINGTKVTQYYQFGVISGDTNTGIYQDRRY